MSCIKLTPGMLQKQCLVPRTNSTSFVSVQLRRCHRRVSGRLCRSMIPSVMHGLAHPFNRFCMRENIVVMCGSQKSFRTISSCDKKTTATATPRYHVPTVAATLVTTAYCTMFLGAAGSALAESEAAQTPAMPPLPSPREAVRKLTGQSTNDIPSETAPSLTDSTTQESPSKEKVTSSDDNDGAGKNNNAAQV